MQHTTILVIQQSKYRSSGYLDSDIYGCSMLIKARYLR